LNAPKPNGAEIIKVTFKNSNKHKGEKMSREMIEEEPKEIITLYAVQAMFEPKTKQFVIMYQEIKTEDTDLTFNFGGIQVTKDSFTKPFVIANTMPSPIVASVCHVEDKDVTVENVKELVKTEIHKQLNNAIVPIEQQLIAIENDKFEVRSLEEMSQNDQ
jgi:hypothetical protein